MRVSVFCISVGVLSACATRQPPPQAPPAPVTEAEEIQMGREADRYLAATRRFYDDSAWGRYVQQVGERLAAKCERPSLPWTFRVMDDPSVNAFALPGGFVYVTRGMLAYLNSEAQLAAVLGHEIGHVAARHVVSRSTRVEMTRMGLVVTTAGGAEAPVQGSPHRLQALLVAHSREAEHKADALGLHYMSDAGYDPTAMPAVLRAIERAVGRGTPPAWLAAHPNWEHRFENLAQERSNLNNPGTLLEYDAYLAHVDGLTFGPDRRNGYFKGTRFCRPGSRLPDHLPGRVDPGQRRRSRPRAKSGAGRGSRGHAHGPADRGQCRQFLLCKVRQSAGATHPHPGERLHRGFSGVLVAAAGKVARRSELRRESGKSVPRDGLYQQRSLVCQSMGVGESTAVIRAHPGGRNTGSTAAPGHNVRPGPVNIPRCARQGTAGGCRAC